MDRDAAQRRFAAALRRPLLALVPALLALGAPLPWIAGATAAEAAARPRGPQQIGGVWEASWQNSRGTTRKGLIVIEQNGARLSARIESHGNVTATGTLRGTAFTLRGNRLGVPFTVEGQIQGKKMRGLLSAILVERPFTAVRRKGR